ncbi:MAG: hypothetical protein K2X81_23850 [Candidatus Obscuribacterales bacterium]|nr:hypothetical protein [Candidatus Obscuribacterales bacterium]
MNMILIAIVAGVAAFGVVGSIVGVLVTASNNHGSAGLFPGLVAGIWAAWPFVFQGKVERYNFLHPKPKRYKVPLKQAFKVVRDILGEKIYNFGDGWKVSTADTQTKIIRATLRWTDEESKWEGGHGGQVNTRTVRVQRLLQLDAQMKEEPNDSTIIQFDFHPKAEGMTFTACDPIITDLQNDVTMALGAGTDVGNSFSMGLPAPPWWLLGLTALALFWLFGDVMSAVFR